MVGGDVGVDEMTILYRSPTIIIDAHEWHLVVRKLKGRVSMTYRWRPLSARNFMWSTMASWKGPKPKDFRLRFQAHYTWAQFAMDTERRRLEGAAKLPRVPTGRMLRNPGAEENSGSSAFIC